MSSILHVLLFAINGLLDSSASTTVSAMRYALLRRIPLTACACTCLPPAFAPLPTTLRHGGEQVDGIALGKCDIVLRMFTRY